MTSIDDRRREFRRLHQTGCFVLPNPWDLGSARLLAQLGFPALATTSSGFAWSLGRPDNHVTLDEALAHFRAIVGAVDLPVNADFEGGFAVEPAAVGANVLRATGTGIAGHLDRGLDRRRRTTAVRLRPVGRAGSRRARRDRRERDRRRAHRPLGGIHRGPTGPGGDDPPAPGLRLRRRRLPLCPGASKPIRDRGGGRRGRAVAGERPDRGGGRGRGRARGDGGSTDQRGRRARAGGLGWFLEAAREIAERGTFTSLARAVPFADINGAFAR